MADIIKIDGATMTINPNIMELRKTYHFIFKGMKYAIYKQESGEVILLEVEYVG